MNDALADAYRRFAHVEAEGVSETYFDWAMGVADDPDVLSLIAELPGMKKQPNLIFAAARALGAPVDGYGAVREWLVHRWPDVESVVRTRSTQTNEAARCAVLLPVLSRLDGELALIEAGASAGLVLYPDQYSYLYDTGEEVVEVHPRSGRSSVLIPCTIDAASVPRHLPNVVWRAGADLNPLDVRNADDVAWLQTLVWPEHHARRERLHAAARIVSSHPPHLVAGDILERIPELVRQAPAGSRVVVFHSAVLVYLTPQHRAEFVAMMAQLPDVTWISNEGEYVLPGIADKVTTDVDGRTILAVDGEPVALVGPHGQSYQRL